MEQRNIKKVILLASAGIGCSILLPFLLPFALGIAVNVISLGIPMFVILCALKNSWALDLLKRGRKGLISLLGGTLPEVSREVEAEAEPVTVETAETVETKEESLNDTESQKVISWYGSIGKKRLNQIISNLNGRGIYECWLRKDGICNVRTSKGYRRVGCLPEYPGEEADHICRLLASDGIPHVSVRGKYIYLSWNGS
ncbi:hypothetical protein [Enterocloster bolteae]|uniref:hypothetical protein n=1 Tax=Enterocloster bolteae TaxID=208479 RepID=UPI0028DBCB99|nr:hypothetical protein [Enterocloster bolteae]